MDIPEKLATLGTQDDEKHNNNTTEYVLDTTIRKQTQIMYIKHESSYKQMMVKTNRTSFVCVDVTVLRTSSHIIGQHKKLSYSSNFNYLRICEIQFKSSNNFECSSYEHVKD
jgi:hypothetical protein